MGLMYTSSSITNPVNIQRSDNIKMLIGNLGSSDGLVRQKARFALIHKGQAAVQPLIEALRNPEPHIRWEAAKALVEIHSPLAAPALVDTMRKDEDYSVRWLASEALIALQSDAIEPILIGLKEHFASIWMREGAHHALRGLYEQNLLSDPQIQVMEALEGPESQAKVPWAVYVALEKLKGKCVGRPSRMKDESYPEVDPFSRICL